MYSAARIEEIFTLRIENINLTENYFDIVGAKSAAGNRRVPTHSKLQSMVTRLVRDSSDGFLLPATPNRYGDRSGATGHRFSALKTALKFGPQLVFHSIRKTCATLFEQAGVAENVAAGILGHELKTLSYGLYSGGTSLDQRRVAIEKLLY
jgi:integrase